MNVTFRPAVRKNAPLLIGLAGPSGSGKTASALKIARGMVGGGDEGIYVIDTEADRALAYACAPGENPGPFLFRFEHASLGPPFTPELYLEAIDAAVQSGAKVVITDSTSHLHEGEGGVLEQHEEELRRMAGDDAKRREAMKFAAWIKPKKRLNRFTNQVLQQRCHFIFCFRAKDKMMMVRNDRGKMEPVRVGWTPICTDRLEYEMTTRLLLPPNSRGVPDLAAESTRIHEHHLQFFKQDEPLSEKHGELLAGWSAGGEAEVAAVGDAIAALRELGKELMDEGLTKDEAWSLIQEGAERPYGKDAKELTEAEVRELRGDALAEAKRRVVR